MEPDWLAQGDEQFVRAVDAALASSEALAGARLDYGRGCPACCLGPFPINRLDVLRLRRGLADLAARDLERAQTIVNAAAEAVRELAPHYPGDGRSGRLVEEEGSREGFFTRFGSRPCPVLDLRSGRCQLYAWRPLTCRTFGPPVRLGGQDLEPCRPCFQGDAAAEVECRVAPDAAGFEDALLDRLEQEEGDQGETIIAYALSPPVQP